MQMSIAQWGWSDSCLRENPAEMVRRLERWQRISGNVTAAVLAALRAHVAAAESARVRFAVSVPVGIAFRMGVGCEALPACTPVATEGREPRAETDFLFDFFCFHCLCAVIPAL